MKLRTLLACVLLAGCRSNEEVPYRISIDGTVVVSLTVDGDVTHPPLTGTHAGTVFLHSQGGPNFDTYGDYLQTDVKVDEGRFTAQLVAMTNHWEGSDEESLLLNDREGNCPGWSLTPHLIADELVGDEEVHLALTFFCDAN